MEFEFLIKRLSAKLKGISYRLNHNFTFFNEEDLYQEALLHLWNALNTGKLNDKTDSYILQGCYFYLKNYIRVHKDKIKPFSLDAHFENEEDQNRESLTIKDERCELFFDRLNDKLLAEVICNNGLTKKEKRLLPLFAEGLTTREIGRCVGISHVRVIKMRREISRKCLKYLDK
jgi:RNA polymerase sigma factor (sigma-70 family)